MPVTHQSIATFLKRVKDRISQVYRKSVNSIFDLAFTFFPMIVLMLVLWLQDRLYTLASLTDPAFLAATLFAEGSWRIRFGKTPDETALHIIGLLGAVVGSVIAAIMVISDNPPYKVLKLLIEGDNFRIAGAWLLAGSILYGFAVRYKLQP